MPRVKLLLKKKLFRVFLVLTVISILVLGADISGLLSIYERKSIDVRMRMCRSDTGLPSEIVLVIIDEASLNAMNRIAGRWPWPRYIHSEVLDFLHMCGARSILFDVMFTENEFGPDFPGTGTGRNDRLLVEATKTAGNVYHAAQIFTDTADDYNQNLLNKPLPDAFVDQFSVDAPQMSQPSASNNYYLPFDALITTSRGIGIVTFGSDDDGVYRSEKLLFNYNGHHFPSLGFASFTDIDRSISLDPVNQWLYVGKGESTRRIPLTRDNSYYVNLYGRYDAYSYGGVFATILKLKNGDVDNLPVKPEAFRDKTVFIGASAAGVEDLKHTAISSKTPGVLLHASIYGNIVDDDFLNFTPYGMNLLAFLVLQLITVVSVFYMNTMTLQVIIPFLSLSLYWAASVILFRYNQVVAVVAPSAGALTSYMMSFALVGFFEGKEKRKIKNILGQYVSPVMLSNVLDKNQEDYFKAEVGVRENLTVFFSDIRGFTSITEKYPVEKVVEVLNRYLSRMVAIIFDHQGTLDKFIGDAIVAFWGAPIRLTDHHYKAVISSVRMREAMQSLNHENGKRGLPPLEIGIGINTGEVILGNIGSEKKLDYTVIGDGVNLASRLEGLTKMYNSPIMISDETYQHVKDAVACRVVDFVKVKGKIRPTLVYQVLNEIEKMTSEEEKIRTLTEAAFNHYRQRHFSEAITGYQEILDLKPGDFLSRLFMARCGNYLNNEPPEDWDGYYEYKTK